MKNFETFAAEHRAAGCDEVLERRWQPDTVGSRTQHLKPGDRFELEPDVPHAERYGPEGATYWVARRNKKT